MPEFSFVIPIYNGSAYISECLDSLLSQTFADIEIICVDDGSTDGSLKILRSYARKDSRVRVLEQSDNRGSARARRKGVLESEGAYVLFSDQDDSYEHSTCEVLHKKLSQNSVDILQYGTYVLNEGDVEQGEIDGLSDWLTPLEERLEGRAILDKCFVNLAFSYSVWNKAYEGCLARRAFATMEDVAVPLGEDNYESFVLFHFAKTYWGVPEILYRYHYGRGYTGQKWQVAATFRRTCGLSVAADLIRSFLIKQGDFDEYEDTYIAARRHMLRYIFDRWVVEVLPSDRVDALRYIVEAWPYEEVLDYVATERPRDTAVLLDVRFGLLPKDAPDSDEGELDILRRELVLLSRACFEKDVRIANRRQAFETCRAYRIGRKLSSSLRLLKKVIG